MRPKIKSFSLCGIHSVSQMFYFFKFLAIFSVFLRSFVGLSSLANLDRTELLEEV